METKCFSTMTRTNCEPSCPLVSVVMPVYRSAKTLPRSIESILHQDFEDFEFIIVNEFDAEDNVSEKVIAEYQKVDQRIKLIQLESHAGIAESLNIGIRAAKGKYIARMDADDYSYPNRLRVEFEYMDQHPNCLLCGTAFRFIRPLGEFIMRHPCDSERIHSELLFHNTFGHPTVFFRREEFVKRGLWYDKAFFGEDFELWTRVNGEMANLPEVCLDYYNDSDSATQKYSKEAEAYSCRIVKQTIRRQFAIEVERYADCLFWPALFQSDTRRCSDLLVEGVRLLHEIEQQNVIRKKFNSSVLAEVLCEQWNRYLWEGFVIIGDEMGDYSLPFLKLGNMASFYDCLRRSLGVENNDEEAVFDIISQRVYNLQKVLRGVHPLAKIVVFGAGVNGKLFFQKFPRYLSKVHCFSDNAISLHGQVIFEKKVFAPEKIVNQYDYIVISSENYYDEIRNTLIRDYRVPSQKIFSLGMFHFIP